MGIDFLFRALVRVAVRHLEEKGLIKLVGERNSKQLIYTTTVVKKAAPVQVAAAGNTKKEGKGKAQKEEKTEAKE